MKKVFIAIFLFCQISPAFSYDENNFTKKLDSLSTTFMLQSTNFFSEADKMNKLAQNPKVDQQHLMMLYATSSQSLCISVKALEQAQSLIRENPQAIGSVLTKKDVNLINDRTDEFKGYLNEFELDDQGCREMMPYTYDSMMSN